MRVLTWYTHAGYINTFLRGPHTFVFVVSDQESFSAPDRPTFPLPDNVELVREADVHADPPDLVIVQRLEEIDFCQQRLGLRLGRDVPAIFLEHNVPRVNVPESVHPLADREDWFIVHVTQVNRLLWDCGRTPTAVVEHGVLDPGHRYTGEIPRATFVVNEPVRRWRVSGADLLAEVAAEVGVDAFGIDADRLPAELPGRDVAFAGNLAADELHGEIAQRRVHLHLNRWTSLGLSLLEAMHLGLPVVVLAATEAATLPGDIGAVSVDPAVLARETVRLVRDPGLARRRGEAARQLALERFSAGRFLSRWDEVFADAVDRHRRRRALGSLSSSGAEPL